MGRSHTQMLEEMQKTLAMPALSFVQNLQPVDENLTVAENLLESLYNDPQVLVEQLLDQLLDLEVMKDNCTSLQKGNLYHDGSKATAICIADIKL